jgi:predicted heme/steroid binding protein
VVERCQRPVLQYGTDDVILVNGGGSGNDNLTYQYVEKIAFDDGTVWDLTQGYQNMVGTNDAHSLFGSDLTDNINGMGGNDYIYAKKAPMC